MYMVEISEDKMCGLSEDIEKGLKYLGKAMQCIYEIKNDGYEKRGHRDFDEDEYEERSGERGGMRRGRYSRY